MGSLDNGGNSVSCGDFIDMAFAENTVFALAVGTFKMGHVFHNAKNRDVHHFSHFNSLFNDDRNQLLRGGHHDDAL